MTPEKKTIFLTGATGYVGTVLTEFAIQQGYSVRGLSRTEAGDAKLRALGAIPVRGDLTSLAVLKQEAAIADIVISLATAYNPFESKSYDDILHIDNGAMKAIADGMEGTGKPLVFTSGTLIVAPDPNGGETNEDSPADPNPLNTRIKNEKYTLGLISQGIKPICIRLAPYVYGRGASGVGRFMHMAHENGSLAIIDGGKNHTTYVHVDDAARLFLLAAEKGKAGEVYNASAGYDVTVAQLYGTIAEAVHVPLVDLPREAAEKAIPPFVVGFISAENKASGAKAKKELGWEPKGCGIIEEIKTGSYHKVAEQLLAQKK